MFNLLLGRNLLFIGRGGNLTAKLCFLQNPYLIYFSTSTNEPSFTVSYLTNSCGLSQENALSVSKKIHLKNSERPDSVLTLLNNYGFTKTQITNLVYKCPKFLVASPDAIVKPKLGFLLSVGFSPSELAKILSSNQRILEVSLKNQLIPSINFLKSVLHTDKNVIVAVKLSSWILNQGTNRGTMISNITALQDHNVPQKVISMFLKSHPRTLLIKPDKFNETVKKVVEMGFNPLNSTFSLAIYVIMSLSKSSWKEKCEVYKRWGWSENDILSAFKKQPQYMIKSEEKIMKTMHFLVNKTCWDSSAIVRCPHVLLLSLEKRIIPRYSVIRVLLSKGLTKKDLKISTCLMTKENYYLEKFVIRYEKVVPHLMNIYKGNTSFLGLGFESEQMDAMEKL